MYTTHSQYNNVECFTRGLRPKRLNRRLSLLDFLKSRLKLVKNHLSYQQNGVWDSHRYLVLTEPHCPPLYSHWIPSTVTVLKYKYSTVTVLQVQSRVCVGLIINIHNI